MKIKKIHQAKNIFFSLILFSIPSKEPLAKSLSLSQMSALILKLSAIHKKITCSNNLQKPMQNTKNRRKNCNGKYSPKNYFHKNERVENEKIIEKFEKTSKYQDLEKMKKLKDFAQNKNKIEKNIENQLLKEGVGNQKNDVAYRTQEAQLK